MLYKYNDNFDEDNYLEEYNDNIYNEFNILLNDENSYDKSIDFSYDIKSYNNNEPIKENQLDYPRKLLVILLILIIMKKNQKCLL